MVGTGKAAEYGILVRGGEALEMTRKIDTIVLDKTGTLTRGKPAVTAVVPADGLTERELLRLAAAAEVGSEHPLGEAIVLRARELGVELPPAATFRSVTGKGIEAEIEGRAVAIGNRALMEQTGIALDGLGSRAEELARRRRDADLRRRRRPARRTDRGRRHAQAGVAGGSRGADGARSRGLDADRRQPGDGRGDRAGGRHRARARAGRGAAGGEGGQGHGTAGRRARRWRWSATASTMPRRWPRPISASPSAPARTWRSPPPTSPSSAAICAPS